MQRHIDSTETHPGFGALVDARFAADDSARKTFDSAFAAGFAARAAKAAVWFDPTMAVSEALIRVNEKSVRERPEWKYIPPGARTFEEGPPPDYNASAGKIESARLVWRSLVEMFGPLVRAGAKFITGSDIPVLPLVPGFSIHWELEELVAIGLSPAQAIQAGTRNAAEAAGKLEQPSSTIRYSAVP
jgi:imidazolonepropionase-like amidohydrolase